MSILYLFAYLFICQSVYRKERVAGTSFTPNPSLKKPRPARCHSRWICSLQTALDIVSKHCAGTACFKAQLLTICSLHAQGFSQCVAVVAFFHPACKFTPSKRKLDSLCSLKMLENLESQLKAIYLSCSRMACHVRFRLGYLRKQDAKPAQAAREPTSFGLADNKARSHHETSHKLEE